MTDVALNGFSVNTQPYNANAGDTVFLCIGTASTSNIDPRPTEGDNALIAGSNTGSPYVLEFRLDKPTRAVAFDFTDVAETGDLLFIQPDTAGSLTVKPCCNDQPYEGFFGYVSDAAFSTFYLVSAGRTDGLGLDRVQVGVRSGRRR